MCLSALYFLENTFEQVLHLKSALFFGELFLDFFGLSDIRGAFLFMNLVRGLGTKLQGLLSFSGGVRTLGVS